MGKTAAASKSTDSKSSVSTKLRTRAGQTSTSTALWNVSLGGVFAELTEPLAFGEEVSCEFSLPVEPRILRCKGFVVWSTKTAPDKAPHKTGVALRLTEIRIAEMRILADCIQRNL